MATKADITPELCRQLLRYEPETGKLFWKFRPGATARWNARFPGKEAFTASSAAGYKVGAIYRNLFYAHRVAFAIYHGRWPAHEVDHINGVPNDNRIANLRDVTSAENGRNARKMSNNTSGAVGVSAFRGKWQARVGSRGAKVHLGTFNTKEEAAAAREAYAARAGYSARHGH